MLKIDADDLPAAIWDQSTKHVAGQWVATAGMSEDPLALGVLSVVRRAVPANPGVLGIRLAMEENPEGPTIDKIDDDSAAKKAGLKVGDIVTQVNGKSMANSDQLVKTIRGFHAGTNVKLTIRRGEEYRTIEATLQARPAAFQDQLGQTLSKRAAGFPMALQHDTVLKPNQCGGPLVGLQGKVLGLNIARAGRVVSYAVPGDVVVGLLTDLKSGKLAPPTALLASTTARPKAEAPTPPTVEEKDKPKTMAQNAPTPGSR
jgi:serine protease Do